MDLTQSTQLAWRKSSYSSAQGADCVEVAALPGGNRAVRDSKDPSGPHIAFGCREWGHFLRGVKAGILTR